MASVAAPTNEMRESRYTDFQDDRRSQSQEPKQDMILMTTEAGRTRIRDDKTTYTMLNLLGKGGFAQVFRLTTSTTRLGKSIESTVAGKIISKRRISKPHNKDKIAREVNIHKRMNHRNVVQFFRFFEDMEHVFIILEYCGTKTLSTILKTRKLLTEPEARYYLKQIIAGCQHIHNKKVVHRDLKLSNLFINDNMQLKIGDFGLSAFIDHIDDKKESICGTPNYISPEVILKAGHSYPVDVWAIGCILYALLIGRPPFETQSLKETYKLIAQSRYPEPSSVSFHAKSLITSCLKVDPRKRPTLAAMEKDPFLTNGFIPDSLPTSAMSTIPPLLPPKHAEAHPDPTDIMLEELIFEIEMQDICAESTSHSVKDNAPCAQLLKAVKSAFASITVRNENPEPMDGKNTSLWVTKWVDYSHKFGFGYQLSNQISGAYFKEGVSVTLSKDRRRVVLHVSEQENEECAVSELKRDQSKDYYRIMQYFVKYMEETLITGGDLNHSEEEASRCRVYLTQWRRTKRTIIMCLSNGTVQVNFFGDHSKIIASMGQDATSYQILYINSKRQTTVYAFSDLIKYGCTTAIRTRLHYLAIQLEQMLPELQSKRG